MSDEPRAKIVAILEDEREVQTACSPRWVAEFEAYFYGQPDGYYIDGQRVVRMSVIECVGYE